MPLLPSSAESTSDKGEKIVSESQTQFFGVYRNVYSKNWKASIAVNGKVKHLGYFVSFEEACVARVKAELKHPETIPHREGYELELYEILKSKV